VALAFVSPAFAADKELPKDLAALQGKWKVVKMTVGGMDLPADELTKKVMTLDIKGDEATPSEGGVAKKKPGKVNVDGSKTPAEITINTPDMGKMVGIYKLEKDTLTMCISFDEKTRPTKFESTKDAPVAVMVLEKVK
jgi:uncharacterized protein (TIGR03067 family)